MKMQKREKLVNSIWGVTIGKEVLDFLDEVAPEKKTFRDEMSLLNHMGRWLVREINRSQLINQPAPPDFWDARKQAVMYGRTQERPRNMLYVIRLLNGKRPVPPAEPPFQLPDMFSWDEDDWDLLEEEAEEESFWENLEKRRERWAIKR